MLQQTRVDQATPYYERFMQAFPTVRDLAEAELDEVLLNWEGLGYYSRARNLHAAARSVVRDHGGKLPHSYDGLSGLPGIGDYTASAVASIAFGVPEAVLDGNVIRVLSRYDAIAEDVTRSPVRRALRQRAQELLDTDDPGAFNEAIMELGATVCTPRTPNCKHCAVRAGCAALALDQVEAFPVKKRRAPVPEYRVAVGVVQDASGRMLIQRRPEEGMLGGLWEFPGGKCEDAEAPEEACVRELREELGIEVRVVDEIAVIRHAYSHFRIRLWAFRCLLLSGTPEARLDQPLRWVTGDELGDFAFPRANRRLIEILSD